MLANKVYVCGHDSTQRYTTGTKGCIPCTRERSRRWNKGNPTQRQVIWRRANYKRYGVSISRPMPAACELCGKVQKEDLHLDHDHETKAFRGWLCISCNTAIGKLGDSVNGLLKAVEYLKRSQN